MKHTPDPAIGIGMTSLRTRQRLIKRLRASGIRSEPVLQAILKTPRHLFIDEALGSRAYENNALPIGFGQTISQPYIVARMTEVLLEGWKPDKVLELGTGSGYQTAILAALVTTVYSVERVGKLLERASQRLALLDHANVRLKYADGSSGWPEHAPFEGIMVTAASQEIPAELLKQLAIGGRLVAPVGDQNFQELIVLERRMAGFRQRRLEPVVFVPLLGGVV
jgi:protein-L-isoaspartate(D-aspartate) O-methyltransferase